MSAKTVFTSYRATRTSAARSFFSSTAKQFTRKATGWFRQEQRLRQTLIAD